VGCKASIDLEFGSDVEPRLVLKLLVDSGWSFNFCDEVFFLEATDLDAYDWKRCDSNAFDVDEFLGGHEKYGRIGIAMVFDGAIGGEFLIFSSGFSLSISINKVRAVGDIPDFTLYISKLERVVEQFRVSGVKCDFCI